MSNVQMCDATIFPCRPTVVLISTCVDTQLRKSMTKTIERLGGSVTASVKDFTVFVTLDAARGQSERGFIKSLNTLSALASGKPSRLDKAKRCIIHRQCSHIQGCCNNSEL